MPCVTPGTTGEVPARADRRRPAHCNVGFVLADRRRRRPAPLQRLEASGAATSRPAERPPPSHALIEAGEAYYARPGHLPVFLAGTEIVEFSRDLGRGDHRSAARRGADGATIAVVLTTGWEADVDATDTLLRASVLSLAHGAQSRAQSVGGRVAQRDGLVLTDTGAPTAMLNAAVVTAPEGLQRLGQLSSFYGEAPFLLCSPFPTGDLSSLGLELMGHPPFMVRPPGGVPSPGPVELTIVEVSDADGLTEFAQTLVDAFPIPGPPPPASLFGLSALSAGARLFIGRRKGSAVAVAGAHVSHGVVHVEWVATRAEERGRGYGEAVTWRATLTEPSLPAVLLASDDGRSVYERMGYLAVLRWTLWFKPER